MTNTNVFSDSQESALMDDETYKELEKNIEMQFGNTENMKKALFHIPEEKPNIMDPNVCDPLAFLPTIKKEEEENIIYTLDVLPPYNDTFPGKLNFDFSFGDSGTGQNWVYSESLEKLFIKMEKTLPLRFMWDPDMIGLFIRTAMVFKLEEHKTDPVKRCHDHVAPSNLFNQNMGPERIKHVVHCVNHASSIYEEINEHLSILTPLDIPEAGSQYVPMCFKFLCKNSCTSGMNRRPTELVFTLEDSTGFVLGRRKLLVRVCSCPKRDKQKEEMELASMIPAKRKLGTSGKKISSSDMHVYKVNLNVVGKENYLAVLKYTFDIMAGQAIRTGQYESFKPYLDEIQHKMP